MGPNWFLVVQVSGRKVPDRVLLSSIWWLDWDCWSNWTGPGSVRSPVFFWFIGLDLQTLLLAYQSLLHLLIWHPLLPEVQQCQGKVTWTCSNSACESMELLSAMRYVYSWQTFILLPEHKLLKNLSLRTAHWPHCLLPAEVYNLLFYVIQFVISMTAYPGQNYHDHEWSGYRLMTLWMA